MVKSHSYNYLLSWIENLQQSGHNYFTLENLFQNFPGIKEISLRSSLSRLVVKRKIVSAYKGFYLILNPEDFRRGILEPHEFMNSLMDYLQKKYYVGLLSAAAIYGASHQKSQEFFVVTDFPQLRPTYKKDLKINYIAKTFFSLDYIIQRNTNSGFINISSPELTAIDLIQYQQHIGGLNRVATVINELSEQMKAEKFDSLFIKNQPVVYFQRLGYMLNNQLVGEDIADKIHSELIYNSGVIPRQPLCPGMPVKGFPTDPKWNLIINFQIDSDV